MSDLSSTHKQAGPTKKNLSTNKFRGVKGVKPHPSMGEPPSKYGDAKRVKKKVNPNKGVNEENSSKNPIKIRIMARKSQNFI